MKKRKNANKKEVFVTLILTESATSVLNLNVPHLDNTQPDNSKVCIVSPNDDVNKQPKGPSTSSGLTSNLGINSGIALFSTSNCSSSQELSDVSEIVQDEKSELFERQEVVNNPLVTVRSKAHADNLKMDENTLYVSLLDSDSASSSDLICRICHGGNSLDDLLTPCRCRGTIALVHLKCLERWLKESNHSTCELCQHRYKIVREPQYSVPMSILVFLRHPGMHLKDLILDLMAFSIYTPSAVASTYMLMLICEALVKNHIVTSGSVSSHIIAFSAVFGMAAIDFTYSSWLIMTLQKHVEAWREWYNAHSKVKVLLPKMKMKPRKKK